MNKKFLIVSVALLAISILGYIYLFRGVDTLRVEVKNYSEKTDTLDIYVEYPQFPELPKAFNEKIKNTIVEAEEEFKKEALENEKMRNETRETSMPSAEYTFSTEWVPDQLNTDMVSFVIRAWYYTGGAHGGQTIYTFNYDLKKNKEIVLSELFPNSPDYLARISQYAINDLKLSLEQSGGALPSMDMLQAGASPQEENFRLFTLGNQGTITFYFSQYQVAPYVYGEQSVVMPLSYLLEKKN